MCSVTQNKGEINMKRKIFLRGIIIVFLSAVLVAGVCEQVQGKISGGMVRLHIIANSDSETDQSVKLMVRDEIISRQKEIFPDGIPKELGDEQRIKIQKIAESVCGYEVTVERGRFYFPTKTFENITLPAGEYDAIRVVLGKGDGKNWWCVMYPPLCFSESAVGELDEKSQEILKHNIGNNTYEIISDESVKTVPALKILELWGDIKERSKKLCENW